VALNSIQDYFKKNEFYFILSSVIKDQEFSKENALNIHENECKNVKES